MDWVMLGGAVLAAWAALSVLGAERQRRIEIIKAAADARATPFPHAATPVAGPTAEPHAKPAARLAA